MDDELIDDSLAHGRRDAQVEHEERDEVEGSSQKDWLVGLEDPRRDDGCNRVRGIVKPVHEVEDKRDEHEPDHDAQAQLGGFHHEFSRTMPSTMLATSSQRSVIDSSRS